MINLKSKRAIIYFVFLVSIFGVIVFKISKKSQKNLSLPQKENVVKIGFSSYPHPFYIACAKGFFGNEGIKVEKIDFGGKSFLANAIVSGDVDTAMVAYSSLFAIQKSSPGAFKIYFGVEETEENPFSFFVVKSDIKSPEDLKGKKIITRMSYAGKVQAESIIKGLGLELDEIELVQVSKPLIVSSFSQPDISGVIDQEPTMTIVVEKNIGKVLVSGVRPKYIIDPFPSAAGVFGSKFVEKNPELAQKVKKVIDRTIEFMRGNEKECRAIFSKELNIDPNIASKMKLSKCQTLESTNRVSIDKLIEFKVENKIIDKEVNFSNAFYKE